jgi:hypothetical protein
MRNTEAPHLNAEGKTSNGIQIAGRSDAELVTLYKDSARRWAWAANDNRGHSSPMERTNRRTMDAALAELTDRGIDPRTAAAKPGKVMAARFAGTCTCGGHIAKGDTIRFDGKAHHTGC